LNSSNEPPQQIDNLRKIQEILRRCNQRFDEYSFREGRHNLDDLAPDDASKRLFAQMYVASMITHTGNMGQLAHQFHEIDYFVKKGYIQPAEIIDIQNIVAQVVDQAPPAARPNLLNLVKYFKEQENLLLEAQSKGYRTDHLHPVLEGIDVISYNEYGIELPLITFNNTREEFRGYIGRLGMHGVKGKAEREYTLPQARLAKSLTVIDDLCNLKLANGETPDYTSIVAETIRRSRNTDIDNRATEDLKHRCDMVLGHINIAHKQIMGEIDRLTGELRYLTEAVQEVGKKGLFRLRRQPTPSQSDFLKRMEANDKLVAKVINYAGFSFHQMAEVLMNTPTDSPDRQALVRAIATVVNEEITTLTKPAEASLRELGDYDPLATNNLSQAFKSLSNGGIKRGPANILEVEPGDLQPLVAMYAPQAREYSLLRNQVREQYQAYPNMQIRFNPNSGEYELLNHLGRKPTQAEQHLLHMLNDTELICTGGMQGEPIAQRLRQTHTLTAGRFKARATEIINGVRTNFPTPIAELMTRGFHDNEKTTTFAQ